VTSFVRPDVLPQVADGAEVLERLDVPEDVSLGVLIPNERGLERALVHRDRFGEIDVFLSASETHNARNVNRSVEESLPAAAAPPSGPRPSCPSAAGAGAARVQCSAPLPTGRTAGPGQGARSSVRRPDQEASPGGSVRDLRARRAGPADLLRDALTAVLALEA